MGKAEVRTVVVPRVASVALLVILSASIAVLIYFLSGRAMLHDRLSLAEVLALVRRYDRGSMTNSALLASVAPVIADVLLFIPWGALAFFSFDRGEGHRLSTYALALAVGVAFALGVAGWQNALPTRVTGWNDAAWNVIGCGIGAMAAHLRKRVRVRFE